LEDEVTEVDTMISAISLDKPVRVPGSASLREAAGTMEDEGTSCVLVGGRPLRLLTDHDLAGAVAAGLGPDAPVEQVATKEPVWVTASTTLRDAVTMMVNHSIRHLLVLTPGGEAQGLLSLSTATRLLLDVPAPNRAPEH
jgi:CBS domain-containing protein